MGAYDGFRIILSILNGVVIVALFVARLQVKNWFLEQKEATQNALNEHNEDPGAHNNHSLVVDLEQKFDRMMNEMGKLTTELAVLNERMKNEHQRKR